MKKNEKELLESKNAKEESDKMMLKLEWAIGYTSCAAFLTLIFVASNIEMEMLMRIILIVIGSTIFAIGVCSCLKIEQTAGYYECEKCHHKYIPAYLKILMAMHIGRTRYMKCPKCGERSWNKKVIKK